MCRVITEVVTAEEVTAVTQQLQLLLLCLQPAAVLFDKI